MNQEESKDKVGTEGNRYNDLLLCQSINQIALGINLLEQVEVKNDPADWFYDCRNILIDRFNIFTEVAMNEGNEMIPVLSVEQVKDQAKYIKGVGLKSHELHASIMSNLEKMKRLMLIENEEIERAQKNKGYCKAS